MTASVDHHDDHHGPVTLKDGFGKWVMRWISTTNHKDLGTLYLWFAFIMFFVGGAMALVIRAELFEPGMQFVQPEFFNQMTAMHALIMIFGAVMPAFVGLANWMIPMMIGAATRQQLGLLDSAVRIHHPAVDVVCPGRCACSRVDDVSAAVAADIQCVPDVDLLGPFDGD